MRIHEHTESFVVNLTKADLEQALKAQYPLLATFSLDDIDLSPNLPDDYARAFFNRDIDEPPLPMARQHSNGKP